MHRRKCRFWTKTKWPTRQSARIRRTLAVIRLSWQQNLEAAPTPLLFQEVFGTNVFQNSSDAEIYDLMARAIAIYEASAEINPFSSKFDASTNATPATNLYTFTAAEEDGRQLFFGAPNACSVIPRPRWTPFRRSRKETFTMYCYANIGVPKNPANPYYAQTNCDSDPEGCNPLGTNFVDYGLGANPNPAPDGTVFFNTTPGDIQQFRGLFKAPSLRNVDQRPDTNFVRSYMHNGVFKSLEEVVHFYNKRNIATNAAGEEVEFTLGYPPEGYSPIFSAAGSFRQCSERLWLVALSSGPSAPTAR